MSDSSLYHILISHPDDESVLSTADHHLPSIQYDGSYYGEPHEVCALVEQAIGAPFRVDFLRPEAEEPYKFYYRQALLVFNIPFCDKPTAPDAHKWIPKDEVNALKIHPHKESVMTYLANYKVHGLDVNGDRLFPYSKAGWLCEATKWLEEKVQKFSNCKVKEIVKVTTGSSGCVLRAETVRRTRFYMKAGNTDNVYDEVRVAYAVGNVMPEYFRRPVEVDLDKRWMLMEDYGSPIDGEECTMSKDPDLVKNILGEWARIQEASINVISVLKQEGVPVLDGPWLIRKLERIVKDSKWYEAQLSEMKRKKMKKYDREEYIARFMSYANDVVDKLSKIHLPLTFVHGDLNPVNVTRKLNGGYTFFDFEGSCISFPLLDAMGFMYVCNEYRSTSYDHFSSYMKRWSKYERAERLKNAFEIISEFGSLLSVCEKYEFWLTAEESERQFRFQEMGCPVSYVFESWEKSKGGENATK